MGCGCGTAPYPIKGERMQLNRTGALASGPRGRGIHELSDAEKQELTEELTLQTGVFGAVFVAGVLYLALLWMLGCLF